MTHHPDQAGELAREVLRHEMSGSSDSEDAAAAVETVCRKMTADLTQVLGSAGVTALLGRALNLAAREHPILSGVMANGERPGCFAGLDGALRAGSGEEPAAAAAAVVACLFGLLITLLGEELGTQPIRRIWPHVASDARRVAE